MLRRQRGKNILFLWVKTSLWKHSPASPAGRLTAPDPLLPPSHAQDEVAALGYGTSVPPHPWPAAGLDPQLSSFRWRYRPESHGLLTPQELCSCTAHSHSSWGREKDTSTNTRNLHVTMMHYSSFPLGFWGFFEKYWYWTGITDETSSDPGAQMRKQLKQRSCCSEGKQSNASGNYSHTLKECIFKYSIICTCSPWKYNTFIKLLRKDKKNKFMSSFKELKLTLRTCSGRNSQQELNVKIKVLPIANGI